MDIGSIYLVFVDTYDTDTLPNSENVHTFTLAICNNERIQKYKNN